MKTVKEANRWWDRLENEGALYVWGMNGEIITDDSIRKAFHNYGSASYKWDYYKAKLDAGSGKIGADCSGAFMMLSGADNTASGYYSGCKTKGPISTIPADTPCMVFKKNSSGKIYHIGWYRPEDGTVSEMASSALNFRRKKLVGGGWDFWGIPKFIDYSPEPELSGWHQEADGNRFYLGDTGQCVRNDWYKDGDDWYWFDGSGRMVTDTWYRYDGAWYYLGHDGAMKKGLVDDNGKWYYLDDDGKMATEPIVLAPDSDGALSFAGISS